MGNCSENKNPLQHSGASQVERLLPGLQAGYVQVNEKEYADWIVFAGGFAAYLNYYDATGSTAGDWQPFFNNDISAILGSIAIQDIDAYRRQIKQRLDFIKDDDNAADLTAVKQKLHELFSALLSLSKALDKFLDKLPESNSNGEENTIGFKNTLKNIIETRLAPALQRLLAYHNGSVSLNFLEPGDFTDWKILGTPVVAAENIINAEGLSKSWWRNGAADWNTYVTGIAADTGIYGDPLWADEYRQINHATNHNLFVSIFDQYTQQYSKLINEATKDLLITLSNWDSHPPHYALFLSFLKLFRTAQEGINTLTQRHLDFYYKEVLRLLPKKAEPNKAHILVELAKMIDDYALTAGTLFKAGKDSAGKEVLYALDKETTFNKAKVVQLKSVYKGGAGDTHPLEGDLSNPDVNNEGRLFASPVANSSDGLGEALTSAHKEWHPYVNKTYSEARLMDIAMPNAAIGFAIASHYLYLIEGERKIIIRLATGSDSDNAKLYNKPFRCYLTTEEGWLEVPSTAIVAGTMTEGSTACAELTISLSGDIPAITDYVADIHGGTYSVNTPLLKMILENDDTELYLYNELMDVRISKIEVKVEVGDISAHSNTGLKQLLLSSDFGPIDASKPFQPFGAIPSIGNRLVIGSREVFSKKNAKVSFNIEWKDVEEYEEADVGYSAEPGAALRELKKGIWETWDSHEDLFSVSGTKIAPTKMIPGSLTALSDEVIVDYDDDYPGYSINSSKGYVAIQLTEDFGHKQYQQALTSHLINLANETEEAADRPVEPYTPVIQSLYLSYSAYAIHSLDDAGGSNFNGREIKFFHCYPFGEAEQHANLGGADLFALPQFRHDSDTGTVYHTGEFYIGIEKLQAQQAVNILFQVMEGTAHPLLAKPDEHIHWSYLAGNQWKPFDTREISDATRQLLQSGIISWVIPADATTDNTLLPAGHIWLRAAVETSVEAVCKLLTVDAQAALVTFLPDNNADDFLDTALPAGTITKLKAPDAAVKKIIQNYSSFGGRSKENEKKFYVRVSERLRHKNRAITIWDYEHLVLENFPQIYKAKCLNHTRTENPVTGVPEYNEIAPGHVTVITIPNLQNRNDTNPLRPYANQNLLLEIEEFLQKKISCHVKLRVRNPQFEEVRLKFRLRLLKGYDDFTYYKKQLQQEITQFLTPWAYGADTDIQFGGKVYKSVLIDFIEERPYVDFITHVEMFHLIDDETPESGDLDEITASAAKSILVSAQASKHEIIEITLDDIEEIPECGDGSLMSEV